MMEQNKPQAQGLAAALIAASFGRDSKINHVIFQSLSQFGKKQPELVLNTIRDFIISHSKIDQNHRVELLKCMNSIAKSGLPDITVETTKKLITLASEDLTKSKKIIKDWQDVASDILVTLGTCYITEVMEELHKKFVPGILPHYYVVQTLGRLATSNVSGMITYVGKILSTTLPLLSLAKSDNMRIVFSLSLTNFCEGILEHISNPDTSDILDKSKFENEIYGAHDILFHVWLQTRDSKVIYAVVRALGKMSLLMSKEKVEEFAPKLVMGFIASYRRNTSDPLSITSALCDVITAVTNQESVVLEHNLDALITNLHNQVCSTPDNASQTMVKNYNEVLRCFGILATCYSAILVGMILQRADSRDEKVRSGNIVIMRHLINSNSVAMIQNQDMIVTGFLKHLFDTSNKVKYALAKLVIAMGTHGYLLREGGQEYVHFIIRQCNLTDRSVTSKDKVSSMITNVQLRDMCDDILKLLTTTVEDMDRVLWPYLFEFVTKKSMNNALGVTCRSLSILADKKRKDSASDYLIDFEHVVNIPQPVALLSRFIVAIAHPQQDRTHPSEILHLLQNMSCNIHEAVTELWDKEIPKLSTFLNENPIEVEDWPQSDWEDSVIKLLSNTLDTVDNEDWICSLGQSLTAQWPLYEFLPEYKNFAFKCLGIILGKTKNKEFVESYLSVLFLSIHHANPLEREGAAVCVGFCASTHIDATLVKVNEFIKINITKKESSYLNIFKSEKTLSEVENIKGTAALSCGYIAFHAPADLITSRVETNIVKTLTSLFKGTRDSNIKVDLVRAVFLIARSLDPEHFRSLSSQPRYVFTAREELIVKLLSYMKDDGFAKPTKLKAFILQACASLTKLDPPMNEADVSAMVKQSLSHVITLPNFHSGDENSSTVSENFSLSVNKFESTCVANLHKLLQEVLQKKKNSTGLQTVFKQLEPYLTSDETTERTRAIQTIGSVLLMFYDIISVSESHAGLSNMGLLMARLLPCCCDPEIVLRMEAVMCVRQLLCIQNKYNGVSKEDGNQGLMVLESISEKLIADDNQIMYEGIAELTRVVCIKLPSDITSFCAGSLTTCLIDAIVWPQHTSANAACLALYHIFESRGSVFANKIEDIVSCLLGKLAYLSGDDKHAYTRDGVLQLLCLLAHHHLHGTLNALLNNPLPFTDVVLSCWSRLGVDRLREAVLEFLLDQLDRRLPYDEVLKKKEKPKQTCSKTATKPSLALACALHELLKSTPQAHSPRGHDVLDSINHRTISVSLVRLGAMLDVQSPHNLGIDPYRQAVELLKTVLSCYCSRKLNVNLMQNGTWDALESREGWSVFTPAISCIVIALCKHQPSDVPHIVSCLNNYLPSIYDSQRATVAAFFAQLVKEPAGRNEVLLEMVMNSLRCRLVDSHCYVRQLCIRGLANIIYTANEQIERYTTSVLSAMMAGMDDGDDPDDSITLEAMSGLAKFLNKVERTNIHSIFVNICLRVRPCFEKDNPDVRAAAFKLFGALARFGVDQSEASFTEQVHSNLVSILLHLNDDDGNVRKSCKTTLREISSRIGSRSISETFQKHLLDDTNLHYGEFMNSLSKIMVVDFPDKVNFYIMGCVSFYKSQWPTIRSNAAIFSGFLMHNLPRENRENINTEHTCAALIQLLKDSVPEVRGKAAEAISMLHNY